MLYVRLITYEFKNSHFIIETIIKLMDKQTIDSVNIVAKNKYLMFRV